MVKDRINILHLKHIVKVKLKNADQSKADVMQEVMENNAGTSSDLEIQRICFESVPETGY